MKLRQALSSLTRVIADEAERNSRFRHELEAALGLQVDIERAKKATGASARRGRRTPALFDPVELARVGEAALRARLSALNIEQLKDVVAQYGMDPGKLVMKWQDATRIADRIVEISLARSTKGDAFRRD